MPVGRFLVYHKKMIVKDSFIRRFRLYASLRLTRDRFHNVLNLGRTNRN